MVDAKKLAAVKELLRKNNIPSVKNPTTGTLEITNHMVSSVTIKEIFELGARCYYSDYGTLRIRGFD